MIWHRSITSKMLGYLLAASLVPLILLGTAAFEISKRIVVTQAEADNSRLAGSFSSYLGLYHDQVVDMAANIAGNTAIGESLRLADAPDANPVNALEVRAQMGRILNDYVRVKGLVSIDLFSPKGVRFHVGETLRFEQLPHSAVQMLREQATASDNAMVWRGVVDNLNTGSQQKKVISVVRLIQHFSPATGKSDLVGILVISLNDEIMRSFLRGVGLAQGSQLMRLDAQGRIALHSDAGQFGQALDPDLLEVVQSEQAVGRFTLNGEEVLMHVSAVDAQQHRNVVITPAKYLNQQVNRLALATSVLIALGVAIIAGLIWSFERSVARPIRAVSDGFLQLRQQPDTLQAALPAQSPDDEIGQLVLGFNNHLQALHSQRAVMQELQQSESLREETALQLRNSEAQLREILDEMPIGVLIIDLEGRVMLSNRHFFKLFGYALEPGSMLRTWWHQAFPDAQLRHQTRQQLEGQRRVTADGRAIWKPQVYALRCRDGEIRHAQFSGTQMGNMLIGTFVDHTQFQEYQQQLERATAEAESANQAKSGFLATMSHEIRTPMNAILGLLQLLQNTELSAGQLDYVRKTDSAAKSLLGLLNDILDFSKVEAGKMVIESEPFLPERLLRSLAVILSSNVGSKQTELLFDVDPALPKVLLGDAMRLQQVLINLGGNAVKFTEQGHVILTVRVQEANAERARLEFSVQDSGIGIAPEHQQHIFGGFSQAESSTTRRFGGTGLGLAISARMVAMMGGKLEVQSALGQGSTFFFSLELPVVQEVPPDLVEPSGPDVSDWRVLVVDDHALSGELMGRMLRPHVAAVDWVADGPQALAQLERLLGDGAGVFPYRVVYMDWQMSPMDGWAVADRIRQLARRCSGAPPVIVMLSASGRESLAHRTEEEQQRIDGFLVKPVTASLLIEAATMPEAHSSALRQRRNGRSSRRQLTGMRILVVEDNLINQQVADELLSAEGAIVSMAANGQQGVDAVRAAAPQFDVVLMDIQMPVLDGYGATQAIRQQLGQTKLPIVAMTANAMSSDREACLAAGMNEHVGKPFDMAQLVSLLIRVTGLGSTLAAAQRPAASEAAAPLVEVAGLDLATALARMSGMQALYARTARDFVQILETVVAELQTLMQQEQSAPCLMLLHTLKGNAATLGATALAQEAARLEQLCKASGTLPAAERSLDTLAAHIAQARQQLQQAIALLQPTPTAAPQRALDPAAQAQLLPQLQALDALLEASDMEALAAFADLREALQAWNAEQASTLDAALQDLDFEAAQQLCARCLVALAAPNAVEAEAVAEESGQLFSQPL